MAQEHDPGVDPLARLECRDEVLQVLYWLAGEGFESDMTVQGISRFLARPESEIRCAVEDAVAIGLVMRVTGADTERYTLTEAGGHEGGRRFVEEFAGILGHETHSGICTDPNCDCHQPGSAAACGHHGHSHP